MIDTHAHLDFPEFDQDREEVISRFFETGGRAIINVGVDLERSRKSVEIAERHESVFASVGLHPEYFSQGSTFPSASAADSSRSNLFGELKNLAKNKKVVAIGETGLDYFSHTGTPITKEQKENQKKGFISQIEIARELDLPVIVHCRDAWDDLYEIISNFVSSKVRPFPSPTIRRGIPQGQTLTNFVLHCYTGEKKDTEKFLKLPNVLFSFSGNITYPKPIERSEKLTEAVRMIPLDRIMLDSDSPLLAPQDFRGSRNEPAHVRYIAGKIAAIKEISETDVERATDENAKNFFKLD